MGIGESIGKYAAGTMSKAYFLFRKYDSSEWTASGDKENIEKRKDELAGSIAKLGSVIDGGADLAQEAVGNEAEIDIHKDTQKVLDSIKNDYVALQVLYNPSTIRLYSRGGQAKMAQNTVGGAGEAAYMSADHPSETKLSVDIYLDDVNINDAFMGDAFNLGLTASNVYQKTKSALHTPSVKLYSELFIAAMTRSASMMVGFVWNKMFFWGELNDVDLTFLMFNNKGEPIRSKISVTIRQDMPQASTTGVVAHYASEEHWEDAFNKMFEVNMAGNEFGVKNAAGNIFGL